MRSSHVTACHGLAAVHLLHVHFVKQRHAIQRGTTGKNQKNSHCRTKFETPNHDVYSLLLGIENFHRICRTLSEDGFALKRIVCCPAAPDFQLTTLRQRILLEESIQ
jgi:hypothetical protein